MTTLDMSPNGPVCAPPHRMMFRAFLRGIPPIHKAYQLLKLLAFQLRLRRQNSRDEHDVPEPAERGIPVPPARLRHRVHGDLDARTFLATGRTLAANVAELVATTGRKSSDFRDILDFGCGCGRVLRYLPQRGFNGTLTGTDIDEEAIAWCTNHMPGVHWGANQFMPPLPYPDGKFDFVFSISVFTHLDEAMQLAWLAELERVTAPGGVLLLTIHGDFVHRSLTEQQQLAVGQTGFLFLRGATGRLKVDGLPDFYQSAYHTRAYIDREWSKYFEVLSVIPRGINAHQDAVVLQRR